MADQLRGFYEVVDQTYKTIDKLDYEFTTRAIDAHAKLVSQAEDILREMMRRGDTENAEKMKKMLKNSKWRDNAEPSPTFKLWLHLREILEIDDSGDS